MKSTLSIISAVQNGKLTHTVICVGTITKPIMFAGIVWGTKSHIVQLPIKTFKSEIVTACDGTVYDFGLEEARELIDKFNE